MVQQEEAAGEQRFCSNCGARVGADASFCGSCGADVGPATGSDIGAVYMPVRMTIGYEWGQQSSAYRLILNRLLLFVKWLFAIPLYIFMVFYFIAAVVVTFAAFWAILITGRFPDGLFAFLRGFVQYEYKVFAYFPLLLTNHWTPDQLHPLRIEIDYPAEPYSRRVLVLLKLPSLLLSVVSNLDGFSFLILFLLAIPAWWLILFTGRYPAWWFALTPMILEWNCRITVWQDLMRDDFSLFGTTTPVKVLVVVGIAVSLIVTIGNCVRGLVRWCWIS